MGATRWWRNTRGEWYVVVQAILLLLVLAAPRVDAGVWGDSMAAIILAAGVVLIVFGGAFCFAGLFALGRNLTPLPRPKAGAKLVETGIYSIVRHPIYGGLCVAAFGWAIAWRSTTTLLLAAILFVFFDIKSRREEQWLREAFAGYEAYRRRVKKLIPFVY